MGYRDFAKWGKSREQAEADARVEREQRAADAEMSVKFANLHMPEDIKSRAAAWGMSAWAEILWNNAFQAGYREAVRDREQPGNPVKHP